MKKRPLDGGYDDLTKEILENITSILQAGFHVEDKGNKDKVMKVSLNLYFTQNYFI